MSRFSTAILAIFTFTISGTVGASDLTPLDCSFVESYDDRWFVTSLGDQIVHMAHHPEACVDSERTNGRCEISRSKLASPVVYFNAFYGLTESQSELAEANINYTLDFISKNAGIEFLYFDPNKTQSMTQYSLMVFWVGKKEYLTHHASEALLPKLSRVQNAMNIGADCFGAVEKMSTSGEILQVKIPIIVDRTDRISDESLARCIKEEAFNVTGLLSDPVSDASLFDDDFGRESGLGWPLFEPFSKRDEVMLKVFGQLSVQAASKEQTRQDVASVINESCYALK